MRGRMQAGTPGLCGKAASGDTGLCKSPAFRPLMVESPLPGACRSMLSGIVSAEASRHSPCQSHARLPSSFTSIYIAAPATRLERDAVCEGLCRLGSVVPLHVSFGAGRRRCLSPFPLLFCAVDEHLQIALRCVNLRCEIIDLERRLSRISGIDGFLSRLACDLER